MTTMETLIRPALPQDYPALLALYAEPDFNGESLSAEEARPIFDAMRSYPFYKPFLLEVNDQPVATFSLLILDNPAHMGSPIAMVENIVVKSGWQGKGLGRRMMAEAGRIASSKGAYKLILATGLKRTGAHQFYEDLGFERYGYSYGLPLREAQA